MLRRMPDSPYNHNVRKKSAMERWEVKKISLATFSTDLMPDAAMVFGEGRA